MSWFFDTTRGYRRENVPTREAVLGKFTVSILRYGLSESGAELIVTDNYLYLNPINTNSARAILRALGSITGTPKVNDILSKIEQTGLTEPTAILRQTVANLEPWGDGGPLRPPGIRITLTNAETIDLGVFHSVTTWTGSGKNVAARDQLLRLLGATPLNTTTTFEISQMTVEDIPDQIRKLADLRNARILSDEEFETKKAELLKRM